MALTIEIRPLDKRDDRSGFTCGEPALDRFFQYYAGQNQFKLRLAVTYVAIADQHVLGFATVAVGSLEKRDLPDPTLRRRMPAYPLPILRLARLGVAKATQDQSVGRALLRYVLTLALTQRDSLGCLGVITDAKPEARAFYEKVGFIPLEGVIEGRLHGGTTPMFLDIRTIIAAINE